MVFTGGASGTVAKCVLVIATVVFDTGGTLCYTTSTIIITDCIVVDSIYILCDILKVMIIFMCTYFSSNCSYICIAN